MSLIDKCLESSAGPTLKILSLSAVSCPNIAPYEPCVSYIFARVSHSKALAVALNVNLNLNGTFPEYVSISSVPSCSLGTFLSFQYVVSSMLINVDPLSMSILMIALLTQIGYTGLVLFPILNK